MENQNNILPHSTTVLVMGILSIVCGCFIIGIFFGIIGIILGNNGRKLYHANPSTWIGFGNLNAGWIMSIIGISISVLGILYWSFWGFLIFNFAKAAKRHF